MLLSNVTEFEVRINAWQNFCSAFVYCDRYLHFINYLLLLLSSLLLLFLLLLVVVLLFIDFFQERLRSQIDRVAHTQMDFQHNPLVCEVLQHWNMVKEKTQVGRTRGKMQYKVINEFVYNIAKITQLLHNDVRKYQIRSSECQ